LRHFVFCFFVHAPSTTWIYTLSLHDALPILIAGPRHVTVAREEQGSTTVLRASHDGYADIFNVIHERILMLTADGREHEYALVEDRKSTRLNSSHVSISYAVFCLKKKKNMMT